MPDVDVFELRFAAAYRRYLDEVETEVDAAAVARSVAAGALRGRSRAGAWPMRAVPAGAWLLVLVGLLIAALVGLWIIGRQEPIFQVGPVSSEAPSGAPSGPDGLTGTWSQDRGWEAVLALHPCGPGEVCGRFELTVDYGAGPRCVYTLEHRPAGGGDYVYWTVDVDLTTDADRFHCAYDGWDRELRVRPQSASSVLVWYEGASSKPSWVLSLISNQFEPLLP